MLDSTTLPVTDNLMLVFAFLVLVLAVCCVAAYFAYRWQKSEFGKKLKAYKRRSDKRQNAALDRLAIDIRAALDDQQKQIQTIRTNTGGTVGDIKPPANPFSKMEQRYIDEYNKTRVNVNGEVQDLSATAAGTK